MVVLGTKMREKEESVLAELGIPRDASFIVQS